MSGLHNEKLENIILWNTTFFFNDKFLKFYFINSHIDLEKLIKVCTQIILLNMFLFLLSL